MIEVPDSVYLQAVRVVMDTGMASIPRIHREIQCGYGAAARALDQMERDGVISPRVHGEKLRQIAKTRRFLR